MSYARNNVAASSKSTSTSSAAGTYTTTHQQALELEMSIVDAMLKRNRCSHQRTKYYQRLSMAVRFVHCKSNITKLWNQTESLVDELKNRRDFERKRRKRMEVFWEIKPRDDRQQQMIEDRDNYRQQLLEISTTVLEQIPEALSRLNHAATAYFREISRGFFLPFCTVAVAAIARIRALIVQMAFTVSSNTLPKLQSLWKDAFQETRKDKKDHLLEVCWTNQQLVEFQMFLHDAQQQKPTTSSNTTTTTTAQRTERSLKDLGLSPPKRQCIATTSCQPATALRADSTASRYEEDEDGATTKDGSREQQAPDSKKEKEVSAKDSILTNIHEDDDIGESVGVMMMDPHQGTIDDNYEEDAAKAPPTTATSKRSDDEMTGRQASSGHELDKNMAIVETLRKKRKKDKKKDRDTTTNKANKKKKKRKKEKKGEDFFDELFGK